jgi:hypothetical protein
MSSSRIQELQEQRRTSVRNLRRSALLFGTTGLVLLALQYFLSIRLWIPFVIWSFLLLSSIGDALRLFRCRRELRSLSHEHPTA